ncbi:MAG: dicarboxylate/amino acid:cation symporter [Pseudomonadota bacterium]
MLNRLIALGLVLGLIVGLAAAATGNAILNAIAQGAAPFGQAFINAIRMIVIPLVVSIIFASVARLGDVKTLGKLGGKTMAFYWLTLIPAILIGMGVMTLGLNFVPNVTMPEPGSVTVPQLQSMTDFLVGLIPANPFEAAANGAILPLIVFTALFAAAAGTLPEESRSRMIMGAEDISAALIKLVWWILWLAPIGVFGLIAPATAQMGWGLIQSLAVFIVSVTTALILFVLVVFIPLLWLVGKVQPFAFFKGIAGAISIAFSTTSTAAAIPVSREEATRNIGVSETIADLVIPLGASMYRPGSALFQGAAIIFLAHVFGVPIALTDAGAILLATFLVSLTVAPVPSSSVVTMAPALASVGIPVSGLGLMLGIDRIPDMMRSAVNVSGQIAAAACVDKKSFEGSHN